MTVESMNIVEALKSANGGQDVFDAFCEVPCEQLNDMANMIEYILNERGHLNEPAH